MAEMVEMARVDMETGDGSLRLIPVLAREEMTLGQFKQEMQELVDALHDRCGQCGPDCIDCMGLKSTSRPVLKVVK